MIKILKHSDKMQELGFTIRQSLLPLLGLIYQETRLHWLNSYLPQEESVIGISTGFELEEKKLVKTSDLSKQLIYPGAKKPDILTEVANKIKEAQKNRQVQAPKKPSILKKSERAYGFIYSEIWISDLLEQITFLKKLRKELKEEGKLILEVFKLSGFSAYPYHPSFSRAAEIISQIEQSFTSPADLSQQYVDLFEKNGFKVLDINYSPPAFIEKKHKAILSLLLGLLKEKLLELQLITTDESEALIQELKEFENRQNTLISKPGLHQIVVT